jgi:2-polyprenyl-3-methyl-5-hydroxy-6-metoxy-1,4-benzoquinol methylase
MPEMTLRYEISGCPLCSRKNNDLFFEDKKRIYLRCGHCKLVFVPRRYWLNRTAQKATYDLHQNDPQDRGYRRFLSRLAVPLADKLEPKQRGLDFGCGPGPTLSVLLAERGHRVDLYDPFYYNDPELLNRTYDFISASEVVEHLGDPNQTFSTLFRMLKPGGWLGIMTKRVINDRSFGQWHYIRDLTHICFYGRRTFEYLSKRFAAGLNIVASDVILLNKKSG